MAVYHFEHEGDDFFFGPAMVVMVPEQAKMNTIFQDILIHYFKVQMLNIRFCRYYHV